MEKKMLVIGGIGAIIVLAVGVFVGQAIGSFWYAPQNAPLPTLNPAEVATPIPATLPPTAENQPSPSAVEATTPTATVAPTLTSAPEPICGGPPTMDILLIGSYRGYYDLADAIRIAHIDFTKPEVVVVTIPRDLLVNLPEGMPYPSPVKLNQSYFLGTPVMLAGAQPTGGAESLARTLALNFGVQVDHYAIISGNGVREIITALGGVTVCVNEDIDDKASNLKMKAGCHHVDGWGFMRVLRYRGEQGDLFRLKNQDWFLQSLIDLFFSPKILTSLDDIIRLYGDLVMTDLSPAQISQLVCLARYMGQHFTTDEIKHDRIRFVAPPEDYFQLDLRHIYGIPENLKASVLIWDDRFPRWLQAQLGISP